MQVLAIERFTDAKYRDKAQGYFKKNEKHIMELYHKGIIRAFWSRGDQPGTVLMFEAESVEAVKKILKRMPLVEKKIFSYSILPLEPYQSTMMLDEEQEILTIVYASEATEAFNKESLHNLLETARIRNSKLDITGLLLYEDKSFLQVIEGRPSVIKALFNKIKKDSRHKHVAKILEITSHEKSFEEWTMGHGMVTIDELESIEGMSDFFSNQMRFNDLKDTQVKKILEAFRSGKWRQKIS
jgi:muconolactone delta-isomerase